MNKNYDVIVIGGGPAGLTAALYTSRAKMNTLILEKNIFGGELANRDIIENFPGYSEIKGPDLATKMVDQVLGVGAYLQLAEVQQIIESTEYINVKTTDGRYFPARTVIIASGSHPRTLNVPGEDKFRDKGVFYCATCDGPHFVDKVVAVAGGGNSGVTEALFLSQLVKKVYIVEALPELTATAILQERVRANSKIEIKCGMRIEAIDGEDSVNSLKMFNLKTNEACRLAVDGILVRIGVDPNIEYLGSLLPLTGNKQIKVNSEMETQITGIFAAGDLRERSPMQISTAVGDGAMAALSAIKFLSLKTFK